MFGECMWNEMISEQKDMVIWTQPPGILLSVKWIRAWHSQTRIESKSKGIVRFPWNWPTTCTRCRCWPAHKREKKRTNVFKLIYQQHNFVCIHCPVLTHKVSTDKTFTVNSVGKITTGKLNILMAGKHFLTFLIFWLPPTTTRGREMNHYLPCSAVSCLML